MRLDIVHLHVPRLGAFGKSLQHADSPEVRSECHSRAQAAGQHPRAARGPTRPGRRRFIEDERMMRVMSAAYYGTIAHVDYHVGKLLDELEKLGMADNTLVLFTADHGNMLGDHGRWFKGVMYEGSSHVPLLWRGPKDAKENTGRVEE